MSYENNSKPKQVAEIAHPVDRFASFLVDLGFMSLLFILVLAPVRKKIFILEMTEKTSEILLVSFLGFCSLAIVGLLYRVVFTYFKGGTPGKLFFGLRVNDVWTGNRPSFQHILLREVFWWLECFMFLIPHLGVYSNKHRRPLHDRMSETIVVSVKGRYSKSPVPVEATFARALTALIGSLVGVVLFAQSYMYLSAYSEKDNIFDLLSGGDWKCEEVSKAEESWPVNSSRLEIALTLHGAGLIDDECIDRESRIALQYQQNIELAYLARAFITSGLVELSDAYLTEICKISPKSEACQFSEVVVLWTEKDWDGATVGFERMLAKASPFVKVWAIKHFERIKDFEREEDLLEDLWSFQPLGEYLISHRVASLWGQRKEDMARIAFQSAQQMLPYDDALGLAGWYCVQRLKNECSKEVVKDCSSIGRAVNMEPSILESELFAVAYIKKEVCEGGNKTDFVELESKIMDKNIAMFVRGLGLMREARDADAREVFTSVLDSLYDSSVLADEVRENLIQTLKNRDELEKYVVEWLAEDKNTWTARTFGSKLFEKALTLNALDLSIQIGERALEFDPFNESLREQLVVTQYKSGAEERAWELVTELESQREPASSNEYSSVVRQLQRKFGER